MPLLDMGTPRRRTMVYLGPAKANHALREVAAVIEGCFAARRAGAARSDELPKIAKDDPDLPAVVGCLRLALLARNPDFEKGIVNADSAVEALVRVKQLPPHVAAKLAKCHTDGALAALERFAADGFRAKRSPLGPGAWGQLLAYRTDRGR